MTLGLIWAQARGGVIGSAGAIPWRVPEDQARFKRLTTSGTVVMGRRTWDSLPASVRPLPGRRNIVVTRQPGWRADGADTAHSVDDALALAGDDVWVIGGAELYSATLGRAELLEVTEVDLEVDGDTFAPVVGGEWMLERSEPATGWQTSAAGIGFRFLSYRRRATPGASMA